MNINQYKIAGLEGNISSEDIIKILLEKQAEYKATRIFEARPKEKQPTFLTRILLNSPNIHFILENLGDTGVQMNDIDYHINTYTYSATYNPDVQKIINIDFTKELKDAANKQIIGKTKIIYGVPKELNNYIQMKQLKLEPFHNPSIFYKY